MFSSISKKYFSSKLYSNIANLQKLKTINLTANKSATSYSSKSANGKANSNTETYLKAFSTANQNLKQANTNQKKLQDIQNQINEGILKKTNKINYESYQPSAHLATQFQKNSMGKDQQQLSYKFTERSQIYIINSLREYSKIKDNLAINKKNIADCEEIMDLAAKLNNEKYSAKANLAKKPESADNNLSVINDSNAKRASEKIQNVNKQTILKNSHIYELYYYTAPFSNLLLSPHKYKESFGSTGKENFSLKMEFEHEQDSLNSEIHKKLQATVEKEMKGFKLSDIRSNSSLFKDPIKYLDPIGFFMEESNRLIDYDCGIEIERLFYVVNKEDDFGATMYKEEGEKKKPKENSSYNQREDKEDMVPMRTTKHFPFTVDSKAFILAKNRISL